MLGRSPYAGQVERQEDLRIAAAALREADVEHLAERIYPTLSGGGRQRVQLARVLAQVWSGRPARKDVRMSRRASTAAICCSMSPPTTSTSPTSRWRWPRPAA